jgi:hypothetical protein
MSWSYRVAANRRFASIRSTNSSTMGGCEKGQIAVQKGRVRES